MEKRKHLVPALLSLFVPGLGQAVKGQFAKAVLIWIGGVIIFFFFFWTFLIPAVAWAWNVYDAYFSNAKPDVKKVEETIKEEDHHSVSP